MKRAHGLSIECNVGEDGVDRLRGEWLGLLSKRPRWHPFERPEFYFAVEHSGLVGSDSLRLYSIRLEGRLVALFPLVRVVRKWPLIEWSHWSLPQHDHLPLASPCFAEDADPAVILQALTRHLAETTALDRLVLPAMLDAGWSMGSGQPAQGTPSFLELRHCNELHFGRDADQLKNALPKSLRKNLEKAQKRLECQGGAQFMAHDGRAWQSSFEEFLAVEDSGWKHDAGTSIAMNPTLVAFYGTLARQFSDSGLLSINRLVIGGRTAAAQLSIRGAGRLFVLKSGYDESLREVSPGNLLRLASLQHGLSTGQYDTLNLVGTPDWSKGWAPSSVPVFDLTCCLPSLRGKASALVLRARTAARTLRSRARQARTSSA